MFYISLIDKNNRKLEIKKSQSQREIDECTTYFKDSKDFVEGLGLDSSKFKLVVEKKNDKKGRLDDIGFLDNYYRGIIDTSSSRENEKKYFDEVSSFDRETLYNYFLNEYISRYETVENDYDLKRRNKLDEIINLFHFDEEYRKQNDNGNKYTNKDISSSLYDYFIDQYNKLNYDNFKKLYRFIEGIKKKGKVRELDEVEEISRDKMLDSLKKKIKKSLNPNGLSFTEKVPILVKDDSYDDTLDFYGKVDNYSDIDQAMTELDMFLDERRFDEEVKHDYKKRMIK